MRLCATLACERLAPALLGMLIKGFVATCARCAQGEGGSVCNSGGS